MKKLLTFFLTALLAFSVGWAADLTYTFTSKTDATLAGEPSGVSASFTSTMANANFTNGGFQLTANNSLTITISGFDSSYKLTGIKVAYTTNKSAGAGTVSARLGTSPVANDCSIAYSGGDGRYTVNESTMTVTETAFNGSNLVLTVTGTTNSIYVNYFTVTYADNGSTPPADTWYRKVTDLSDLVAGKKCIFVYENGSSSAAMGALNSNGYGTGITGLSITDNRINIGGKEVIEYTLGGSSNAWTFLNPDNRYLGTNGYDTFTTSGTLSGGSTDLIWTINSSGYIRNNSSNRFITYNSTANFVLYTSGSYATIFVQDLEDCATPTFSPDPDNGPFTGEQSVTISCDSPGATIYYTTDGTTPTTSSAVYTSAIPVSETTTIKAIAVASGYDNSAVAEATYTINSGGGPSLSTIYRKVTSTEDLTPGLKYILVYESSSTSGIGMGAIISNKGTAISGLTINNNKIDIGTNSGVIEFTMGGQTNAYTFISNDNYLAYTSSTNLSLSTTLDDKARWTLESYGTGYYLKNNNSNTRGVLYRSDVTPPVFGAYALSNLGDNYSPAVLYVQEDSDAPMMQVPESLSIEDATGDATGSITVSAQNLTDGISVSTSGNYWSATPNSLGVDGGDVTVEYTGRKLVSIGSVNLHTATADVDDENVAVNYLYTGDIYIVTKIPGSNWNFNSGDHIIQMTRQSDGTYKAELTVPDYGGHNGPGDSETEYNHEFLQFTQRVGEGITWGSKYFFGPEAGSNWWLTEGSMNNPAYFEEANSHVIQMLPGQWTITVDPSNNSVIFSPTIANPVITLASGRYYEAQTTTITCATEIAHIYYTTDGSDPSLTNGTLYDGNPVAINADMTLKAVAVLGTNNPTYSDVVTATYTIRALDGTDFLLANTVTVNDEYVLVYSSNTTDYAMSTFHSDNYYNTTTSSSDFELNGTIVTRKNNNVNVLTIEPAGNGQYYIVDQDRYYLYYNSGNQVHRSKSLDANNNAYKWTITIGNDGVASIENVGTEGRFLRCNTSGGARYACYTNPSNAKLYKRAISEPRIRVSETEIDLGTIEAGGESVSKTFTVHGMNLTQDVTLSVADAENFTVQPTTISATDANNGYVTVTVTYTGSATTASTTVTVANSEVTAQTVTVTAARTPLAVTISPEATGFTGRVQHVTIEANNPNATIYYSLDGENFVQYTGSFSHEVNNIGDSFTVYAYAVYNGETSSTVDKSYTRLQKESNLFVKVTEESQIVDGQKYIIVYEGNPGALYGNGLEANVRWDTDHAGHINIAGTDTYVFTLDGNKDDAKFKIVINGTTNYLSHTGTGGNSTTYTNTPESLTISSKNDGYSLTDAGGYYMSHNGSGNTFRWYNSGTNGDPVYLYVQEIQVEAPEITPASGEYYGHQDVTITADDGVDIYYTTDGSDPTTSSTPYEGTFAVHYNANSPTTIKAIAVDDEGNVSDIAEVVYTWIAPKVTVRPASRDVYNPTLTVVIGCNPVDATVYYTTDGSEPSSSNGTLYEGPFEVTFASLGDQVTVKAIAYNDDDVPSTVDAATYTYAEKVINVDAPFFSPLEGKAGGYSGIYYGDQTLEIATSTANADIYYVIEPVSGTTPPSSVSDPTKSSNHYTGPISMTVGNSYRVKAIAYIGDHASTVSEGYYIIKSTSEWTNHTDATTILENVAQLRTTTTGSKVTFRNPIQVVYMSTMANDPTPGSYTHPAPEYVYVRDNSGYGVIYFGKGATMWATQTSGRTNSPATIFEMGDWIDGSWICGTTGTWSSGLIPQVGTGEHTITSWPNAKLGNTKILAEDATCSDVRGATADNNLCGHYLHLRNTTLNDVENYSTSDTRHSGTISDASGACTYYDRFWLYSGSVEDNITFSYNGVNYTMSGLGHYDQAWFDEKGTNATFDVFCVGDYYSGISNPYEVYPLDFLWIFKPVITPPTNLNCTSQQVVDITVESPDWGDGPITPTIYYKTDDMEDWEEFIGPFIVNSDTHVQAYAQVHTDKFNDIVRSDVVSTEYKFANIKEPIITPDGYVIEVVTGEEEVTPNVTISTNLESPDAVTLYTTNGEVPTLENGTVVENGQITLNPIKETTTVTAISYIEVSDGQGGTTLVWSKPVTQTYTFVKSNGVVYDLVSTVTTDKIYVIVNKDAYMGLSTSQNGNNRGSTGVMFTDGTKEHVYGNAELALFVLESASAGRYNFKNINGDGYLTVTTNDVANLSTSATASSYSEAGVTIAQDNGNPASIMFNYDGTNRYLRYFAKGRTFTTNADVTLNEDVFLYGTAATPLAVIESEIPAAADQQVTVADALIGAWAVDNGTNKYLWAKDMGYSIAKTNPVKDQTDYVKDILGWQKFDWDQSNWVIIDFANSALEPGDFVGKKLKEGTITGKYVEGKNNGKNYRIVLESTIIAESDNDATKYPGYMGPVSGTKPYGTPYENAVYNTYVTANFLTTNTNVGDNTGFVATEGTHAGDHLFFMNPKLMEVALVYGVWAGNDKFTVYLPNYGEDGVTPGTAVNAWGLKGTVKANWAYNRLTSEGTEWGKPGGIDDHVNDAYFFHAVITPKANANSLRSSQGTADGTAESGDYEIYPLDMSDSGNVTAVRNVNSDKEVVSVRYYNVMGMESEKPFEGINIVVTRYSDGSASTVKVLR